MTPFLEGDNQSLVDVIIHTSHDDVSNLLHESTALFVIQIESGDIDPAGIVRVAIMMQV